MYLQIIRYEWPVAVTADVLSSTVWGTARRVGSDALEPHHLHDEGPAGAHLNIPHVEPELHVTREVFMQVVYQTIQYLCA
jgi:hypothetical protein